MAELRFWRYDQPAASWSLERSFKGEGYASPSASAVSAEESDAIWLTSSSYTQPTTLAIAEAAAPAEQEPLKSLPAFYEAAGLQTQQLFATSADGTQVPYFLVSREDAPLDGSTPTLLYGYGGFEISLTPGYAASVGANWLEKGYAVRRSGAPTPQASSSAPLLPLLTRSGLRLGAVRAGEYPRRRRVRAALAPGRTQGEAQQGVRGL